MSELRGVDADKNNPLSVAKFGNCIRARRVLRAVATCRVQLILSFHNTTFPTGPSATGNVAFTVVMTTKSAYLLADNVSPATVTNTSSLLRIIALALISGAAIASRLFAVINFESIIHEL